jgi:hypothetical protein
MKNSIHKEISIEARRKYPIKKNGRAEMTRDEELKLHARIEKLEKQLNTATDTFEYMVSNFARDNQDYAQSAQEALEKIKALENRYK